MSSSPRSPSRREMIRGSLAAAAAVAVVPACSGGGSSGKPPVTPDPPPTEGSGSAVAAPVESKQKRILILGGTGFLGPATVEAALARGHHVTIFNRGKREKLLPLKDADRVEHLYGNRDPELPADDEKGPDGKVLRPDGSPKGLEQLVGKQWDAVIDNSGYYPRMVKASADLLAKQAKQYIFISSISAYDEASIPGQGGDETVKLAELKDPTVETMGAQFENYGGLKVLCERAAQAAFGDGATIVRPGYIVGPGDPTDRYTYWPVRASKGGTMLAPGAPDDPLQWIDVRDLAEWLVTLVENKTPGSFNAIGPAQPAKWSEVLDSCVRTANAGTTLQWVPATWLDKNGMGQEDAFPIWIAPVDKYAGFHRWNTARSVGAGLKHRPIDDTNKALLEWFPKELERRVRVTKELADAAAAKGAPAPKGPPPDQLRAGPSMAREQELLAGYKKYPNGVMPQKKDPKAKDAKDGKADKPPAKGKVPAKSPPEKPAGTK